MPRVVVLGCGTGVGKTRVSVALLNELKRRGERCFGLKPIESGIRRDPAAPFAPPKDSDAAALASAGSLHPILEHPLYALPQPISPHLAARAAGESIDVKRVSSWIAHAEIELTPLVVSDRATWTIIESAGGVFSPLTTATSNLDLALVVEPAIWILVATDALGVLHDVSATLQAMAARGRRPDHLVLSGAREPDASTGTNARELEALGIVKPSAVLARNDDSGIRALGDRLLGTR